MDKGRPTVDPDGYRGFRKRGEVHLRSMESRSLTIFLRRSGTLETKGETTQTDDERGRCVEYEVHFFKESKISGTLTEPGQTDYLRLEAQYFRNWNQYRSFRKTGTLYCIHVQGLYVKTPPSPRNKPDVKVRIQIHCTRSPSSTIVKI